MRDEGRSSRERLKSLLNVGNRSSVSEAGRWSKGCLKFRPMFRYRREGEVVDRLIKVCPKREVSQLVREMIDGMVEAVRELEMFEVGREVVRSLVELIAKGEEGKRMRERRERLVKPRIQSEMGDG